MATLKRLILTAVAVCASGCATVGHDLDVSRIDQLTVGVSTYEDAHRLFGEPTTVTEGPHGAHLYAWRYGHANAFSGHSEGKSVVLVFANTGKLSTKTRSGTRINTD